MTYQGFETQLKQKINAQRWDALETAEKVDLIYDICLSVARNIPMYRLPQTEPSLALNVVEAGNVFVFDLPETLFKQRDDFGISNVIFDSGERQRSGYAVSYDALKARAGNDNYNLPSFTFEFDANKIKVINSFVVSLQAFLVPDKPEAVNGDLFLENTDALYAMEILASYFASNKSGDMTQSQKHLSFATLYMEQNDNR